MRYIVGLIAGLALAGSVTVAALATAPPVDIAAPLRATPSQGDDAQFDRLFSSWQELEDRTVEPLIATRYQSHVVGLTQSQQDRLNEVGRIVAISPLCQRLGMTVDPELSTKASVALRVEAASWSINEAVVNQLNREAISRQSRILQTDLNTVVQSLETDDHLRSVKNVLLSYGRICVAATTDAVFSSLIVQPTGYSLNKAATDAVDGMLEAGGLASWQTPQIKARGNLMLLAGACRSKIGAARSDELLKEFGRAEDPRVRQYYTKSFDSGLTDPSLLSTLAACNKAIASFRLGAK